MDTLLLNRVLVFRLDGWQYPEIANFSLLQFYHSIYIFFYRELFSLMR